MDIYKKLNELKKSMSVLDAGEKGSDIFRITTNADSCVFAFTRSNDSQSLFAVFNLTKDTQRVTFTSNQHYGNYSDFFTNTDITFNKATELVLSPWEFHLYIKK